MWRAGPSRVSRDYDSQMPFPWHVHHPGLGQPGTLKSGSRSVMFHLLEPVEPRALFHPSERQSLSGAVAPHSPQMDGPVAPPGADVCSPSGQLGLGLQREHESSRQVVGDKLGGMPCPQGSVLCSDSPFPSGQSSCPRQQSGGAEVGHQVLGSRACCLSRQAILPGLPFPLMLFYKGIK